MLSQSTISTTCPRPGDTIKPNQIQADHLVKGIKLICDGETDDPLVSAVVKFLYFRDLDELKKVCGFESINSPTSAFSNYISDVLNKDNIVEDNVMEGEISDESLIDVRASVSKYLKDKKRS